MTWGLISITDMTFKQIMNYSYKWNIFTGKWIYCLPCNYQIYRWNNAKLQCKHTYQPTYHLDLFHPLVSLYCSLYLCRYYLYLFLYVYRYKFSFSLVLTLCMYIYCQSVCVSVCLSVWQVLQKAPRSISFLCDGLNFTEIY